MIVRFKLNKLNKLYTVRYFSNSMVSDQKKDEASNVKSEINFQVIFDSKHTLENFKVDIIKYRIRSYASIFLIYPFFSYVSFPLWALFVITAADSISRMNYFKKMSNFMIHRIELSQENKKLIRLTIGKDNIVYETKTSNLQSLYESSFVKKELLEYNTSLNQRNKKLILKVELNDMYECKSDQNLLALDKSALLLIANSAVDGKIDSKELENIILR